MRPHLKFILFVALIQSGSAMNAPDVQAASSSDVTPPTSSSDAEPTNMNMAGQALDWMVKTGSSTFDTLTTPFKDGAACTRRQLRLDPKAASLDGDLKRQMAAAFKAKPSSTFWETFRTGAGSYAKVSGAVMTAISVGSSAAGVDLGLPTLDINVGLEDPVAVEGVSGGNIAGAASKSDSLANGARHAASTAAQIAANIPLLGIPAVTRGVTNTLNCGGGVLLNFAAFVSFDITNRRAEQAEEADLQRTVAAIMAFEDGAAMVQLVQAYASALATPTVLAADPSDKVAVRQALATAYLAYVEPGLLSKIWGAGVESVNVVTGLPAEGVNRVLGGEAGALELHITKATMKEWEKIEEGAFCLNAFVQMAGPDILASAKALGEAGCPDLRAQAANEGVFRFRAQRQRASGGGCAGSLKIPEGLDFDIAPASEGESAVPAGSPRSGPEHGSTTDAILRDIDDQLRNGLTQIRHEESELFHRIDGEIAQERQRLGKDAAGGVLGPGEI